MAHTLYEILYTSAKQAACTGGSSSNVFIIYYYPLLTLSQLLTPLLMVCVC